MAQRTTGRLSRLASCATCTCTRYFVDVSATICLQFWSVSSVSSVPRMFHKTTIQRLAFTCRLHSVSLFFSLTNCKISMYLCLIYMYIYKFSLCLRHSWRRAGEEGKRRRSWSQEIDHNYFSYARAKETSFFFPFFSFFFSFFFCFSSQRLIFRSAPKWQKGVNQPSLPPLPTPMN